MWFKVLRFRLWDRDLIVAFSLKVFVEHNTYIFIIFRINIVSENHNIIYCYREKRIYLFSICFFFRLNKQYLLFYSSYFLFLLFLFPILSAIENIFKSYIIRETSIELRNIAWRPCDACHLLMTPAILFVEKETHICN